MSNTSDCGEKQEEIQIHWFGCDGIELTDKEVEDLEELFEDILNDEMYFDETDAWVMEFVLFEFYCKELKFI